MNSSEHTALRILKQIRKAGFTAYFAGGSVRDKLLGREAKDYDIATNALPEQIEALFPKTFAVGKAFGVIVVVAVAVWRTRLRAPLLPLALCYGHLVIERRLVPRPAVRPGR